MTQMSLMRQRRFAAIFWTQFLGAFNDNLFKNALVILVAYKALSVLGLAADRLVVLCGGLFILPFFLFSATAGQLADKRDLCGDERKPDRLPPGGWRILLDLGFLAGFSGMSSCPCTL